MDALRMGDDWTNRRAKYYTLTPAGRNQLQAAERSFECLVKGVRTVLLYA
jgi:PadR family transcriptional regulator PadR